MGLIDTQLETLKNTVYGNEIKQSIVEALDILDENLPFIPIEEVEH